MSISAKRNEKVSGIFDNSEECENQISGCSNSQFKKFDNVEYMEEYYNSLSFDPNKMTIIDRLSNIFDCNMEKKASAYIDGRYNPDGTFTSYLYFVNNSVKYRMMNDYPVQHPLSPLGDFAGKLLATYDAIELAISHGIEDLTIYQSGTFGRVENYFLGNLDNYYVTEIKQYFNNASSKVNVHFSPKDANQSGGFKTIRDFTSNKQLPSQCRK